MGVVELPFESRFYAAPDGLKLYVREYGSTLDPGVPVVCLAGLTRNSADFGRLASALAAGLKGVKRRVLALDYRGRGLSAYDRNWKNYSLEIENADVLSVLAAMEIEVAIFIGTSRGGLHTMLLSATRPGLRSDRVAPRTRFAALSANGGGCELLRLSRRSGRSQISTPISTRCSPTSPTQRTGLRTMKRHQCCYV